MKTSLSTCVSQSVCNTYSQCKTYCLRNENNNIDLPLLAVFYSDIIDTIKSINYRHYELSRSSKCNNMAILSHSGCPTKIYLLPISHVLKIIFCVHKSNQILFMTLRARDITILHFFTIQISKIIFMLILFYFKSIILCSLSFWTICILYF